MGTYGLGQRESQSSCCLGGHVLAAGPGWDWEVLTGTGHQRWFLRCNREKKDFILHIITEKPDGQAQGSFFREYGRPLWVGVNVLAPLCFLPAPAVCAFSLFAPKWLGFQLITNRTVHLHNYCSYQGFPYNFCILLAKTCCLPAACINLVGCLKVNLLAGVKHTEHTCSYKLSLGHIFRDRLEGNHLGIGLEWERPMFKLQINLILHFPPSRTMLSLPTSYRGQKSRQEAP